jgi:hypothetical protein
MQIKTFHTNLTKQNIPISIEALTSYLKDLGLDDVPQNMVNHLTADLKSRYATALERVSQGEGQLIGVEAKPPVQAPQQPETISLEAQQAIASGVNGLQQQAVNYVTHQETQLVEIRNMLGQYNRTLDVRLWSGVAQDIKAQGPYNLDIEQMMSNSWAGVKSDLQSKIGEVNAALGINNAAA